MNFVNLLSLCNETDCQKPLRFISSIEGLPPYAVSEDGWEDRNFLISIRGMADEEDLPPVEEESLYSMFLAMNESSILVATFICKRVFLQKNGVQIFNAAIGESRWLSIQIIKAWSEGAVFGWRDLEKRDRKSWLVACMSLAGRTNWRQTVVSRIIAMDFSELTEEVDFYCYIGEQLFGKNGYAGMNFAGLCDVLSCNKLDGLIIRMDDGEGAREAVKNLTQDENYFNDFIGLLKRAGAILSVF